MPLLVRAVAFCFAVGAAFALAPLPATRGVVSIELDGLLWDASAVRSGVGSEMRTWLGNRLLIDPPDVFDEMDQIRAQGAEFGMMMPGIGAIQREVVDSIIKTSANVAEDEAKDTADEAIALWLQAFDGCAEALLAPEAVPALKRVRELGFGCCVITSGLGDSKRMPSLAPLVDLTVNTCDFTVPASDAWSVALQVAPANYEKRGAPWVHVGGAAEGGLGPAANAGFSTVALVSGGGEALKGLRPTRCIESLSELPAILEGIVQQ